MNKFKIALALMLAIAPACGKRARTKENLWNGASIWSVCLDATIIQLHLPLLAHFLRHSHI
jgi:hypothetical protein